MSEPNSPEQKEDDLCPNCGLHVFEHWVEYPGAEKKPNARGCENSDEDVIRALYFKGVQR